MYVLDTDTLIYFLKKHPQVVAKVSAVKPALLATTIINHSELLFGAYASERQAENLQRVQAFLQHFRKLPFCEGASLQFAQHKSDLRRRGTPVADLDLMIGSIAQFHGFILVTNNTRHFSLLPGLKLENWAV